MDYIINVITDRPIVITGIIAILAYLSFKLLKVASEKLFQYIFRELNQMPDHYENGVVYIHTFPRSATRQLLNMSPFGIKVESWLRLKKIPHKTIETLKMSSTTGQIPYIILDGEEIADSNKIIEFLEKKFEVLHDEGLTAEQQGLSHSFLRMVDESLSWTYFTMRYMHFDNFYGKYFKLPLPRFLEKLSYKDMRKRISNRMVLHGMGRKSISEIAEVARADIQAISDYLGTKKFLLGDAITKVDCAVFAHLSQIIYVSLDYPHKEALKECANILPYMERIKKELWPDWNNIVNMELFE